MSKHMPPVPPENRSDKGPGSSPNSAKSDAKGRSSPPDNLKEQARQGDINQNTHHQGYQQDR